MNNAHIAGEHLVALTAAALALIQLAKQNPMLASTVFTEQTLEELLTAIRESHNAMINLEHRN
jgi:low affinity Fe/Cu permease